MQVKRYQGDSDCEQEYLHCSFRLVENAVTLARLSCYINPHHGGKSEKVVTFGCLDLPDNTAIFTLLFDALLDEAKKLNATVIIGPMDGSTWNTYRIVTSPQPNPFLLEVQTPSFYPKLFKAYGFKTLAKYKSTMTKGIEDKWERNQKKYHYFTAIGVSFLPFDKENSDQLFAELGVLCNAAFKNNFLFSPIALDHFVNKMRPLLPLINPRYTIVARHLGKIVGFIFSYRDTFDKTGKTIVVKTLARAPDPAYKGLASVLSSIAMRNAKADDFTKGIHALMVDFNTSAYISSKFNGEVMRSYELLSYKLEQ